MITSAETVETSLISISDVSTVSAGGKGQAYAGDFSLLFDSRRCYTLSQRNKNFGVICICFRT